MAELHIQRRRNVWPWVIALIVVLLLIAAAVMWADTDRIAGEPAGQATTATTSDTAADNQATEAAGSTDDPDTTPPAP